MYLQKGYKVQLAFNVPQNWTGIIRKQYRSQSVLFNTRPVPKIERIAYIIRYLHATLCEVRPKLLSARWIAIKYTDRTRIKRGHEKHIT